MDCRFHGRQKTYSIGLYGNGRDGTFSLADARRERDKAKDLLKEGKDPSTEKQLDKHRQAAARPFEQWADEWLAKKKVEKVKRGRIVAVRDPKTIEVLELRVGYVKARFGKLCRQDIKRPDVLAFMRFGELSRLFWVRRLLGPRGSVARRLGSVGKIGAGCILQR
jgi:Arm domain-containing DNA-binding protein